MCTTVDPSGLDQFIILWTSDEQLGESMLKVDIPDLDTIKTLNIVLGRKMEDGDNLCLEQTGERILVPVWKSFSVLNKWCTGLRRALVSQALYGWKGSRVCSKELG